MRLRSATTVLLILWFLAGHPLMLYAESLDGWEIPGGADQFTRKARVDPAAPLPDPALSPEDDARRLHPACGLFGQLVGATLFAEDHQVLSKAILKRLSRAHRSPLLLCLQIAPPSCRDSEPPPAV